MKNTLLFACFFLLHTPIFAQQFYIRLDDASGFNTDIYQDSLEAAAERLVAAFPDSTYRDSFKVFDFGFYLHQEVTEGGYPEPFQQMIDQVGEMSPYYLLFGKQTDKTGIYTKFWVEVKLPETRGFRCLTTEQRNYLRINIAGVTKITYYQPDKTPYLYADAERNAMDSLSVKLPEIVDCCYGNRNSGCSPCLTAEGIRMYLSESGFVAIPITILNSTSFQDTSVASRSSGQVEDCANKSIRMDGVDYLDFGETIENIMSCYGDPTVKAVITDNSCNCAGEITSILAGEVVLKIHIWKHPFTPQIVGVDDTMYVWMKAPNNLGKLPFKGHFSKDM